MQSKEYLSGPATTAKFSFVKTASTPEKMWQTNQKSTTVFITSDQKNQKKNDFITNLPQKRIFSEGNYHVALLDITFPTDIRLPIEPEEGIFLIKYDFQDGKNAILKGVIPDNTKNIDDLVDVLNVQMGDFFALKILKSREELLSISLIPKQDQVLGNKVENVTVVTSKKMKKFLNGEDFTASDVSNRDVVTLFKLDHSNANIYQSRKTPNFKLYKPKNLFIYTDLVEPTPLGGHLRHLLKIIPITDSMLEKGGYTYVQLKTLDYHEVTTTDLESFRISIFDHSGRPVDFIESNIEPASLIPENVTSMADARVKRQLSNDISDEPVENQNRIDPNSRYQTVANASPVTTSITTTTSPLTTSITTTTTTATSPSKPSTTRLTTTTTATSPSTPSTTTLTTTTTTTSSFSNETPITSPMETDELENVGLTIPQNSESWVKERIGLFSHDDNKKHSRGYYANRTRMQKSYWLEQPLTMSLLFTKKQL